MGRNVLRGMQSTASAATTIARIGAQMKGRGRGRENDTEEVSDGK